MSDLAESSGTRRARLRNAAGAVAAGLLAISAAGAARAEEGGVGHYTPGAIATLIDLPPTKPGWAVAPVFLHYNGDASRQLPIAGEVAAGIEATTNAFLLGGFYTFDNTVLGARYSVGAFLPIVRVDVEAEVTSGATTVRRDDSETGLGDVTLMPAMLAWEAGYWQYNAILTVYTPTGGYEEGRLANPGLNYWTVDPTFGVAYNNEKNGFNAAIHAGITINSENPATDYRSGSMFHLETSVQQLLPVGPGFLGLGAEAFYLQQVTGDSGDGATFGDFQGRTVGLGPVLTYLVPRGEQTFAGEVRWLPEINTQRRLKGDYVWLKLVYQF